MTRKSMALVALGLAAVLFVAINVVAQMALKTSRLDLTADKLYTLSPGTLKVLGSLKEPVTLRFFFSEKLSNEVPSIRTYGLRVRELLQEYAKRSDGRIRLEIIDPEPFSAVEDRAVVAGVRGVPIDNSSGRQFYFGLVGNNTIDKQEVISFFQPDRETFLEYDLTKLVLELGSPDKPLVGVLTDMPIEYGPGGPMAAMRGQSQPYAILSQLKSFFDVRILPTNTTKFDSKIRVLVVARPFDLPAATQYAIDQYVMKGGHALLFVDPYPESDLASNGQPSMFGIKPAGLTKLFDAWGLAMPTDQFVADPRLAITVTAGSDPTRRRPTPYPAWIALDEEHHELNDVVTAQLGTVNVGSAGSLSRKEGAEIDFIPLLASSADAQLLPTSVLSARLDPEKLFAAMKPGGNVHVLAARVTGKLKSAFPDGPPPPKEGEEQVFDASDHVKAGEAPANLIVVADTDLIEDRFWAEMKSMLGQPVVMPFAANGDFIINAVENLTGGVELNTLRGRAGSVRPFTLVEDLRRAAGKQMLAREQELSTQLRDTERQLGELQSKMKQGSSNLLSAEEQKTIDRFRGEVQRIRVELREVQRTLNRDIEALSTTVKAINIVAVPLVVALAAIGLAGLRARRRARATRD